MHKPNKTHWIALKRVLRYLKGTIHYGLFLKKPTSLQLQSYCDSNSAGDLDQRNSTTGCILFLGENLVSRKSVKKKIIARSSIEAEYKVITKTASEIIWMSNLLAELGVKKKKKKKTT